MYRAVKSVPITEVKQGDKIRTNIGEGVMMDNKTRSHTRLIQVNGDWGSSYVDSITSVFRDGQWQNVTIPPEIKRKLGKVPSMFRSVVYRAFVKGCQDGAADARKFLMR